MFSGGNIIQKHLWGNGPTPGEFYNFAGSNCNGLRSYPEYTAPGIFGSQRSGYF